MLNVDTQITDDDISLEITRVQLRFSRIVILQMHEATPRVFAIVYNSLRKDVSLEQLWIRGSKFNYVIRHVKQRSLLFFLIRIFSGFSS